MTLICDECSLQNDMLASILLYTITESKNQ